MCFKTNLMDSSTYVESIWQKEINKRGYEKKSRVGYSIGLNFPPDWGERTASLRVGDQTILEEGD